MVAKTAKKLKITSKEERDKKASERIKNGEYFQKYMISIGQWRRKPEGGIEMCGNYVPAEDIQRGFKEWLKKTTK